VRATAPTAANITVRGSATTRAAWTVILLSTPSGVSATKVNMTLPPGAGSVLADQVRASSAGVTAVNALDAELG
jgi:hypothetical protein